MLSVIMLDVVMLSVIILNVVMLSVIMLNAVMLSVVVPLAQPGLLFLIFFKLTQQVPYSEHFIFFATYKWTL
jgi:hypothetical protein